MGELNDGRPPLPKMEEEEVGSGVFDGGMVEEADAEMGVKREEGRGADEVAEAVIAVDVVVVDGGTDGGGEDRSGSSVSGLTLWATCDPCIGAGSLADSTEGIATCVDDRDDSGVLSCISIGGELS